MGNNDHYIRQIKADAAQLALNMSDADILVHKINAASDLREMHRILSEVKPLIDKIQLQVNDLVRRSDQKSPR